MLRVDIPANTDVSSIGAILSPAPTKFVAMTPDGYAVEQVLL